MFRASTVKPTKVRRTRITTVRGSAFLSGWRIPVALYEYAKRRSSKPTLFSSYSVMPVA